MHFFKALLFLGAGSIIHAVADEQDMRKMGGLKNLLPFSYVIMLIGSLALIGFPFLAGFYSKDTILEVAYAKYTNFGHFAYYLGSLAAFFTAFYSTRLLFLVFLSEPNGNKNIILNAHEGSWKLTLPLFILSFFSITVGFLAREIFIGFGTDFWNASIFILPSNYLLVDIEFIDLFNKLLPLILTILGAVLAFFIYLLNLDFFFSVKQTQTYKYIFNFLSKKWYFDKLYNTIINQNVLLYSYYFTYKDIDRGLLEIIGPSSIENLVLTNSESFKKFQSGNIFHYLFIFLCSLSILIFFLLTFFNSLKLTFIILSLFFLFGILI